MSSTKTLRNLQSAARKLGLSTHGTKQQLYNRIYYTKKIRKKYKSYKKHGGKVAKRSTRSRKFIKRIPNRRKSSKKRGTVKGSRGSRGKANKKSYFKRGNKLSEPHRKYCRCIYHVADQQSPACLRQKKWEQSIDGKQCYNPYAICSKSTKRTGSVDCFKNTNLNALPASELKALADLKGMSVSELRAKHKKY